MARLSFFVNLLLTKELIAILLRVTPVDSKLSKFLETVKKTVVPCQRVSAKPYRENLPFVTSSLAMIISRCYFAYKIPFAPTMEALESLRNELASIGPIKINFGTLRIPPPLSTTHPNSADPNLVGRMWLEANGDASELEKLGNIYSAYRSGSLTAYHPSYHSYLRTDTIGTKLHTSNIIKNAPTPPLGYRAPLIARVNTLFDLTTFQEALKEYGVSESLLETRGVKLDLGSFEVREIVVQKIHADSIIHAEDESFFKIQL
ncbi:hypothetical protein M422DRAFT_46432 [Sphaerobolus stellatus SS14]|uniref:Unplaced genomic scaffold SPHSTscaffold_35, whole genome shotgun sequence n=1 Tax=Sphaerobolus stellatus (strain SS14) TaxID=990650 RepID=A0A0C9USM5_SPHS4|nr:hypothetical protein M422DRAFT_46432 [Sphaerobolus stellatus SS14]